MATREQWILAFSICTTIASCGALILTYRIYRLLRDAVGGLPIGSSKELIAICMGIRNHMAANLSAIVDDLDFIRRKAYDPEAKLFPDPPAKPQKRRWFPSLVKK